VLSCFDALLATKCWLMGEHQNGQSFDWRENQETQVDKGTVEKVPRKRASASKAQQEERDRLAFGQNQRALELGHNANQAQGCTLRVALRLVLLAGDCRRWEKSTDALDRCGAFPQMILIQVKGGGAAMPTEEDGNRLRAVARRHHACGVLLAAWRKGKAARFFRLRQRHAKILPD
jgi:hypothetical protein